MDDPVVSEILHFAQHCGQPGRAPVDVAARRGWIDQEGRPTPDGRALVRELSHQTGVRSVFRGVA